MRGKKMFAWTVAAFAAATVCAAAGAAGPDPGQLALRPGEVPNAKAKGHSAKPDKGYVASYDREFELTKPYGSSQLVYIDSDIELAATAATATKDFALVRKYLSTAKGREDFAAGFVQSLGKNAKRKDITVGKLKRMSIGDEAVDIPASVKIQKLRLYTALTVFRVDRVVSILVTVGAKPITNGDITKLSSLIVGHVTTAFTPAATAPPAITGTPQQGQTLTATPGTWTNAPTVGYQWQKCDATGNACADLPGATTSTYAVQPADVGATLRVTATATNRFGTQTAQSAPTAAVT